MATRDMNDLLDELGRRLDHYDDPAVVDLAGSRSDLMTAVRTVVAAHRAEPGDDLQEMVTDTLADLVVDLALPRSTYLHMLSLACCVGALAGVDIDDVLLRLQSERTGS